MKKDTRKIVTSCAPCQLLKAKRARAHRHFRAKVFCTPRTSWGIDFYGVAESKNGYNNILGAIDLASAESRLFASKTRSAEILTDCILHGIVLRDGCPLGIPTYTLRCGKRVCVQSNAEVVSDCRLSTNHNACSSPHGKCHNRKTVAMDRCLPQTNDQRTIFRMGKICASYGTHMEHFISFDIKVLSIRGRTWIESSQCGGLIGSSLGTCRYRSDDHRWHRGHESHSQSIRATDP